MSRNVIAIFTRINRYIRILKSLQYLQYISTKNTDTYFLFRCNFMHLTLPYSNYVKGIKNRKKAS